MELLGFILIAGIWAAFLLPRVFDTRKHAPITTTRNYERDTALLAAVSASASGSSLLARRRVIEARRRTLLALGGVAAVTLVTAIWTGSVLWLGASIFVDVALAVYITVLLYMKQQWQSQLAQVVPLGQTAPVHLYAADTTVRIVAG